MQELCDSIKRPNLRIMGIEYIGIHNIFSKITSCLFRYRKPPGLQTDITKLNLSMAW
jgi:hypothetical protein